LSAWGKFGAAQLVCFVEMLTSLLDDYDLQAESSEWLFKSPLAGAGAYCGGPTTGHTACYYTPCPNRRGIKRLCCL